MRRQPMLSPVVMAGLVAGVVVLLAAWFAFAWFTPPGTIIVVRHVEKAAQPADNPGPSEIGARRAQELADLLAPLGVDAIYATEYLRTFATASPLANRLTLPVHIYDARDSESLAARLNQNHRRDNVLVVGHSNTVPAIVQALSGRDVGTIDDRRYGDIFIIVRGRFGRTTLLHH
jgi:broad specificity phosphatase PhoE